MPAENKNNIISLISRYKYYFFILLAYLLGFVLLKINDEHRNVFFIFAVFIILISLLFYLLFRSSINHSIKNLVSLTDKLKSNENVLSLNNYEAKLAEVKGIYDELLKLGNEFRFSYESDSIYTTYKDILQRLIDELNAAKVFKINRNEFLGNVAHELRTPLFALQLSLETLYDGAVEDENVRMDFLAKALVQTNRMKELVEDLISISKLEAGMKLSRRYFSINILINEVIDELKSIAENNKLSLSFITDINDDVKVFGDVQRIKQVLINLIDNSIKYTSENGIINIRTNKSSDKYITIQVEDNGMGIPADDLPRIFERFYRVDKNRSRNLGGSGLGLSIVKHILDLHQSKIDVVSEQGKGSQFTFLLPTA